MPLLTPVPNAGPNPRPDPGPTSEPNRGRVNRRRLLAAALAVPLLAAPLLVLPQPARARRLRGRLFAPGGAALGGVDPVAYFSEGAARAGRNRLALKWGGAMWHFATSANRDAFEANPRAYLPQYGGWCALAMAAGRLAAPDPQAWTLHEGRLYLTASLEDRMRWRQDIPGFVAQADRNWAQVLAAPAE